MMRDLFLRYKRVILFGLVGCVNTLVDFAFFTFCNELLALPLQLCQVVGYCCGILCSFLLNRNVTFRDGERNLGMQLSLFLLVNLVTLGISVGSISLLVHAGLWEYVAKALVTGIVMICNYFGYKIIAFRVPK